MKTEVANFDETFGQYMLQEAVKELEDRQADASGFACIALSVAEEHVLFIVVKDGRVGQSDAVDVTREILQGVTAITYVLDIHNPIGLPDFGRNGFEDRRCDLLQARLEPLAEQERQCWRRHEEPVFRPAPDTGGIETAAGDQIVDVWMIDNGARPCVQHAGYSGDSAEPFRVQT